MQAILHHGARATERDAVHTRAAMDEGRRRKRRARTAIRSRRAADAALLLVAALVALPASAERIRLPAQPARTPAGIASLPALPVRVTAATGFDFSTGDFGGDLDSDIWYVPFSLRVDWRDFTAKVTVPYLRATDFASLAVGEPVTPDREVIRRQVDAMPTGPSFEEVIAGLRDTRDGIGDVILEGRYTYRPDCAWLPETRLTGKIKLGTASARKQLGTGEHDYGLEIDFAKPIGRWLPFAGAGYRFIGDPRRDDGTRVGLRDRWNAYAGISASLTRSVGLGIVYDWRESAVPGRADFHELQPYASWRVHPRFAIDPYVLVGLSRPAPDFAAGLQLRFIVDAR